MAQGGCMCRGLFSLLSVAVVVVLLVGCGGSGHGARTARVSTRPVNNTSSAALAARSRLQRQKPTVAVVAKALAACKHAVRAGAGLSGASKSELDGVCGKVNGVPADDVRLVRVVCNEVVSASSSISGEAARRRGYAACYARAMSSAG